MRIEIGSFIKCDVFLYLCSSFLFLPTYKSFLFRRTRQGREFRMVHPSNKGCIVNNPLEQRPKAKTARLAFNILGSESHHLNVIIAL